MKHIIGTTETDMVGAEATWVAPDVAKLRRAFPGLTELTYLNVGTCGLTPQPILERYQEMITHVAHLGYFVRDGEEVPAVARARRAVAALLDVPPATIAFNRNATDGINYVFGSLDWRPEDEVLISDQEHPALLFPWLTGQQRGLFVGKMFDVDPDPAVTLRNVEALLTPRTRMITFSHVSSQTGIRLPAAAIAALARAASGPRPILTLVDGAQAVGQLRLSVGAIACDYYVTNGHKWLGGPKGSGLLMVADTAREHLTPPYVGGGLEPHHDGLTAFWDRHDAQRLFESGTQNLSVLAVLADVVEWLDALGWEWIEQRERHLAGELRRMLATLPGVRVLTPERWEWGSAITSFSFDNLSATAVFEALWQQRIVTRLVPEHNALRISTTYFNDTGDLTTLVTALERIMTAPSPAHPRS